MNTIANEAPTANAACAAGFGDKKELPPGHRGGDCSQIEIIFPQSE